MVFERPTNLIWAIPVLLALLVNQNVLQNRFGWDDENIIRELHSPDHWLSVFLPMAWRDTGLKEDSPYYRPIVSLSYLIDYRIWGTRPFGFHFSVWLAHILNTALVFFLARELIPASAPALQIGPFLAASLFAVHPAHAEAVAWIAGRTDVFCTTFLLLSFLIYVQFRRTNRRSLFILSTIAFFLALLTKEAAVGLIFLFPAYDYLFHRPSTLYDWKEMGRRWLVPWMALILYFVLRFLSIKQPFGGSPPPELLSHPSGFRIADLVDMFGYYLRILVFPYPQSPFVDALPNSLVYFFSSGLVLLIVATAIIHGLLRGRLTTTIGLGWTLAILGPAVVVGLMELANTPVAERYLYGPSAGFLIAAAGWIAGGLERLKSRDKDWNKGIRAFAIMMMLAVLALWSIESWDRNRVWYNPLTFWQAAVAGSPESGYPYRALAIQYAQVGKNAEAERLYRQANEKYEKALGSENLQVASTLGNLAALYYSQQRYAEAEPAALRSLAIFEKFSGPESADAAMSLHNIGLVYLSEGRYDEAKISMERSLKIKEKWLGENHPAVAATLEYLAKTYAGLGRQAEAEAMEARARAIREKQARKD